MSEEIPLPPSRRRFIATMLAVISRAVASILGIPLAGFFALPALRQLERRWLEVGSVSDFPEGEIRDLAISPHSFSHI